MTKEYRGVPLYGQKATGEPVSLDDHEAASQARYESVIGGLEDVKENVLEVKAALSAGAGTAATNSENQLENKMDHLDRVNLHVGESSGSSGILPMAAMAMMGNNNNGGFAGHGLALGAAGLVAGALLGNGGGFFGGNRNGNFDSSAAELATARVAFDTVALQSLNGISAAIPTAAASVKDALLASDANIISVLNSGFQALNNTALQQSFALSNQASQNQIQAIQALNAVNQNVSDQGARGRETTVADGATTRALITSQFESNLQRQLGVAEVALLDANRRRDHDQVIASITNTNTAVAAQAQGQQQQQQQQILQGIQGIFPILQGLIQVAHATNGNVIAGNTGAVTTGAQTSTPTNVNA